MAGTASTRMLAFVLLAAGCALCQQPAGTKAANSLPDAPTPQADSATPGLFRALPDTQRLPVDTVKLAEDSAALRYDPGHFSADEARTRETSVTIPFLRRTGSYHGSTANTVLARASDAASSFVLMRDIDGKRKLNTPYLLTVLTAAVAHSAYRPYWRRSATQPFSDFGSTVGSDAGMNVLHEFEPGIMQLVKSHEPRFVSKIGAKISR